MSVAKMLDCRGISELIELIAKGQWRVTDAAAADAMWHQN